VLFPVDIGDEIGGVYDWNITSVPQTQLDGLTRSLPMGRVVGGGSILNGMIWTVGLYAPSTVEHSYSPADFT
jgi:choline dehydrogenase